MVTIVVLFNLKPGVTVERYEAWARSRDLPAVNSLASVDRFEVLKTTGLLSGHGEAPYQYVELLQVESVEALRGDITATPVMADVAREFRDYAESPVFMVTAAV